MDRSKWRLTSDLQSGEPPRFKATNDGASSVDSSGTEWLGLGSNGSGNGALNGEVLAILVSDLAVVVGGTFTNAAGIATADYVAVWDGQAWHGWGSNGAADGAINGPVRALVGYQNLTYVGGDFTNAAGITQADYLAVWTGDVWTHASDQGALDGNLSGPVYALAAGDLDIYVGGNFTNAAGEAAADYFAIWDGWQWSAAGSNSGNGALNDSVNALAVGEGDVYVGGSFTNAGAIAEADHLAIWNGTAWLAVGSNGPGNGAITDDVRALALSGNSVYAGGDFLNAAGIPEADFVARWSNGTWSALGSNGNNVGALNSGVTALRAWGSTVFVGGAFTNAAGLAQADSVARWNGNSWAPVGAGSGGGVLSRVVRAITVSGFAVYLGGAMVDVAGESTADHLVLAILPSPWSPLSTNGSVEPPLNDLVNAFVVFNGDLYVGGLFKDAGGVPEADFIARWNGSQWTAVGSNGVGDGALNNGVAVMTAIGGTLLVGGYFQNAAGNAEADYLARWNGNNWSAIGSNGAGDGALNDSVRGIAQLGTYLYAGGGFTDAGGNQGADYVTRWNGSAWSAVGSSAGGYPALAYPVASMATLGSYLYIGGGWNGVAGVANTHNIARWNGTGWFAVGSNGSGGPALTGSVFSLVASATDLYAVGSFNNAGGLSKADRVARWNGAAWLALGSDGAGDGALKNNAYAVFVSGSNIYVGGRFVDAAGIPEADHIARWNGTSWSALGSNGAGDGSLNADVYAIAMANNYLIAGGMVTNANGIPAADFVARYAIGGPSRKPDGRIKKGSGSLVGNNVYNVTGDNQTRQGSAARGATITFTISVQNDASSGPDRFTIAASGLAATGYQMTYFRGSTDITAAVTAGTYATANIGAGNAIAITVKAKVLAGATTGSSVTRLVTISSVIDPSRLDAVKFVAKRS